MEEKRISLWGHHNLSTVLMDRHYDPQQLLDSNACAVGIGHLTLVTWSNPLCILSDSHCQVLEQAWVHLDCMASWACPGSPHSGQKLSFACGY